MPTVLLTSQSSAYGGVERKLLNEVRVLKSLGADVLVSVPNFSNAQEFKEAILIAGGEPFNWNPYKFIERQHCGILFSLLSQLHVLPLRKKNIVFASIPLTWTTVGLSRAWVLQRAGIPYTLSFRCTYPRTDFKEALRSYIKQALSGMVGAYSVSLTARQSFIDNFGALMPQDVSIPVISNGVDLAQFSNTLTKRAEMRRKFRFKDDDFIIVTCGRLDPIKRPNLIFSAFKLLAQRDSRVRLVMVGDGPLRSVIQEMADTSGIAERFRLIASSNDVAGIYAGCDAYISPSLTEGSPSAAIEALAASLPIIVTDIEPFIEGFAGCDSAFFVSSSEAEIWADKLQNVCNQDPKSFAQLRNSAKLFAGERFNEQRMIDELRGYFQNLLLRFGE